MFHFLYPAYHPFNLMGNIFWIEKLLLDDCKTREIFFRSFIIPL